MIIAFWGNLWVIFEGRAYYDRLSSFLRGLYRSVRLGGGA